MRLLAENIGSRTVRMRRRFQLEIALSGMTAALAILTLISREWIEWLTGRDPDGGNGSLEWALVVVLAALSIGAGMLARLEWSRAHPVTDAE